MMSASTRTSALGMQNPSCHAATAAHGLRRIPSREGHLHAADAHNKAAAASFGRGDRAKAKKHTRSANAHGVAADRLAGPGDTMSNPVVGWIRGEKPANGP
jgi:predicted secreted protein